MTGHVNDVDWARLPDSGSVLLGQSMTFVAQVSKEKIIYRDSMSRQLYLRDTSTAETVWYSFNPQILK
jgi:hypothetical protein